MAIVLYKVSKDTVRKAIIAKRASGDGGTWATGGARWAFFGIFIVLIVIVLLGTLRANKKRSRQGIQPIYGTRWMTPPNYGQSQTQYNQPAQSGDPDVPSAYVPTYTAEANEYDMGYYDTNGKFHANPNAKAAAMAPPQPAHRRNESTSTNGVVGSTLPNITDEERTTPLGPPPGHAGTGIPGSPVGPPPGAPPGTPPVTSAPEDSIDPSFNDFYRRPSGALPALQPTSNFMNRQGNGLGISSNIPGAYNPPLESSSAGTSVALPSSSEESNPSKI